MSDTLSPEEIERLIVIFGEGRAYVLDRDLAIAADALRELTDCKRLLAEAKARGDGIADACAMHGACAAAAAEKRLAAKDDANG